MKLLQWFKDMIDADRSVSSKRFCGVLGWIICMFVLVWCTVTLTQAPVMVETVLYIIAGLLGLDKISDMIGAKNDKKKKETDSEETE